MSEKLWLNYWFEFGVKIGDSFDFSTTIIGVFSVPTKRVICLESLFFGIVPNVTLKEF